jgi:hypothetical protein
MKKLDRERVQKQHKESGHFLHLEYTLALQKRADLVARHLCLMKAVFGTLFSDENFRTLLRAESITTIPICLEPTLLEEKKSCR